MGPKPTYEGYVLIDHRASPGLSEADAIRSGLPPDLVKEGAVFEMATLCCRHCQTPQHKNPLRKRPRAQCAKCNYAYVCDVCAFKMTMPDYIHVTFDQRKDLVFAGKPDPLAPRPSLLFCT